MIRALAKWIVPSLCVAPALAGGELTPERVANLRSVASAVLAPDGKRAAYVLAVPRVAGVDEDGPSWAELHVVDVEGGRERAYVAGQVTVSALAWTPDGREIGFLAKGSGDKETALYLIPVDGGEARRALALEGAIEAYDFAPDGKRVVCIAAPGKDAAREKRREKGFQQEVYEEDAKPSKLWIATLDGKEPRALAFNGHCVITS